MKNIIVGIDKQKIVGVVILNNTGMKDFIPENILVYIAVDGNHRGKGYGKKLMEKAIATAEGNIALHVEPDNPAKKLYEKLKDFASISDDDLNIEGKASLDRITKNYNLINHNEPLKKSTVQKVKPVLKFRFNKCNFSLQ